MFVDDLLTAYVRYANSLKFQCEILTAENGHAILKVTGNGVWKAFQHEGGKHVVQRIPPTERNGRRQTSVISVAVLPLPPVHKQIIIPEKDLIIKTQCGHGPGGQHQNTSQNSVRMTHIPTGISVFINGKGQHRNKQEALAIIAARVTEFENSNVKKEYFDHKHNQMKGCLNKVGSRGDKRRTYNFIRSKITDHCLNRSTDDVKSFMKGDFSAILYD